MTYQKQLLTDVLQSEQMYVNRAKEDLDIPVTAVLHNNATNTCHEKARILGWGPEKVVKAVFFHYREHLYGFVFPELGDEDQPSYIDRKEVIHKLLDISKKKAKSFQNSYCPKGMEYGTCTPFVHENSFDQDGDDLDKKVLDRIFIHEMPSLDDQLVDISIGGHDKIAHRLSLHLPYRGIYEILHEMFGDQVQKAKLIGGK